MHGFAVVKSKIQGFYSFWKLVIHHFFHDDGPYRASALAFTSLLAVVPLMTVAFSAISSLPVIQNLNQPVQDFIFENFMPATGKIIQSYLSQFVTQVSKLSVWGVVFLVATALLMMITIEHSMNKIWRTHRARSGVDALLLYWAILSLAPIFLGLSITITSYLAALPFQDHHAPLILVRTTSYLLSLIAFTAFYIIVPNCKVKFKDALIGGLVTTILFETAKQLFGLYLSKFHYYELLYGAFAIIPVFFVWVYWVWVIILLGAEVSYVLSLKKTKNY